ncbi:hypothetical protein [Parafrankia soli]|uniref:hypothetical protein n=1 Tax=Parafrankia soli TaxID=2599596 RepID=UPI000A95A20C|nr:hypothetical protein [Parafrankia soli]
MVSRVVAAAADRGLDGRIDAQRHDLTRTRPTGPFDLVYACYFHSPVTINRNGVLRQAAAQVAPGGCFLLIDHASPAPWSWKQLDPADIPTPRQTLDDLGLDPAEWFTVRCERIHRTATGPDGHTTATVADNVIVLRRT